MIPPENTENTLNSNKKVLNINLYNSVVKLQFPLEIFHDLNFGKITDLFPAKIFHNFQLEEIIRHCVMGHTELFGDNANGTSWWEIACLR